MTKQGRRFEIVDAGPEIGHAWRSRWDSLRLFTSRRYNSLPGMPFPAAPDDYPGKDDVADYLQAYAVATGPFQVPFMPPVSSRIQTDVHQIHSAGYRRPEDLPPGRVLVVGAGNSGCQIALELSATRSVDLAVGNRIPAIPQRPLGRDIWSWATALRLDRVTAGSRLGRRLSQRDQIIGASPRRLARRHGIGLRPRVLEAEGRMVTFADGRSAAYDAVVWATGFITDDRWIDVPGAVDELGLPRQSRGVTPSPGLYTLGRTWQHTRGSALLGWVGNDAAFLAQKTQRWTRVCSNE